MNNPRTVLVHAAWAFAALVTLAFSPADGSERRVEQVRVECGTNQCFILCQPDIGSAADLGSYVERAHSRLALIDQALSTEAVVTLAGPLTLAQVAVILQPEAISNTSLRCQSEFYGELFVSYPLEEDGAENMVIGDSAAVVVSMRITADVATLSGLSKEANVLCVDIGAVELVAEHQRAMVIVVGDLVEENMTFRGSEKGLALSLPTSYSLAQNYPNPFNPVTAISFGLPRESQVKLEILNTLGQVVTTLFSGRLETGTHYYHWDGSDVASGIYLYRLRAGDYVETKKMVLLK